MADAPERIWVEPDYDHGWTYRRGEWFTEGNDAADADLVTIYVRADLARPKVKPLVWVDLWSDGSRYDVTSDNPLGYDDSIHGLQDGTYHSRFGTFPTLDEAKATAQADYERRIKKALLGCDDETT